MKRLSCDRSVRTDYSERKKANHMQELWTKMGEKEFWGSKNGKYWRAP